MRGTFTVSVNQSARYFLALSLVINHDYSEPCKVMLRNFSGVPITIEAGDSIVQMAVTSLADVDTKEMSNFKEVGVINEDIGRCCEFSIVL